MWAAGQCVEVGLSGRISAEDLAYGGRLKIGRKKKKEDKLHQSCEHTAERSGRSPDAALFLSGDGCVPPVGVQ